MVKYSIRVKKTNMMQKIINRLFRMRHYWRRVPFDEIAELYTSRLVTVFAVNIVNLFAAVYLYKMGYSVQFIALFYAVLYGLKIPFSIVVAKVVAYWGPKHGVLFASLLRIPSLAAFAFVEQFGLPAIIIFGVFQQIASGLYDYSYLLNFSKVKNDLHAGKEIGVMQIIEKIARVVSPIIGGVIAAIYSPIVTIILAMILFIVAAVPLFRTVEPTATRIKLKFSGFPWRLAWRSVASETVIGFDFVSSGLAWTLFITIFVFSQTGSGVYAAVGGVTAIGVLASMLTAWVFGKMVDRRKGKVLLSFGVFSKMAVHAFQPFVSSPPSVIAANVVGETATSAYAMPFMRIMFDVADASGHRFAYIMFVEMALNIGAMLGALAIVVLVGLFGDKMGLQGVFMVAAAYQLIMLLSRREAY